jgi:EAL and modified HD-GYP domain-containing signal transduction protein
MDGMATQTDVVEACETATLDCAGEMRYVARQPIMDAQGRVFGYELLSRNCPETGSRREGDQAARTLLDNAVIFGMERFTNGLPAFVLCNEEALTEKLVQVLQPEMTVLEIPASLEAKPRLIEACVRLKKSGFRLALDDFVWRPELQPLTDLADYLKVDFTQPGAADRRYLRQRSGHSPLTMVAKKVFTQEEYRRARSDGFNLFQGDYFCRPVLLKSRKVPSNRIYHFQILQLLYRDPIDLRRLSKLVMRDPSLTYRLLLLVNSPFYAIRQEVRSIESAIVVVGEEVFRRIATLAILSELNAQRPAEILRIAFVRARFCERAARFCAFDPAEQYLLGMFSLLSAMLQVPMEELIPALPLRDAIRDALLGTANPERMLLAFIESYERGEWSVCDAISQANCLRQDNLLECYAEAVEWAEGALRSGDSRG